MPDMAKSFTFITKTTLTSSLWKRIVQIGKLINSWVSWIESCLERSENIIILEMIIYVFKTVRSNTFPDMHTMETGQ